jgi:hypothetical protein
VQLLAAAGLILILVTQFGDEHEEGEAFSLPKDLLGQRFHSPVIGLTHP